MDNLGIEYVCTANGGRSPIAEVSGQRHAEELGLSDKINIFSSGSHYDVLQTMDMPFSYLAANLESGLEKGLYSGNQKVHVERILSDKEKVEAEFKRDPATQVAVKALAKIAEDYFTEEEEHFRDLVLVESGLSFEGQSKQYTPKSEVQLVLPMKDSNAERVRELSDSSVPQKIVPVREYAGLAGEITNPFGKGIEVWRQTRDGIVESVKASIDKAAEEYL